jgi:putative nucleotidyltransferase with HDIG domain
MELFAQSLDLNTKLLKAFPVEKLIDNSVTDFDLFVEIGDLLALYATSGYRWNKSELNDLLQNNYNLFLMREQDLGKAESYVRLSKIPAINNMLAPKKRIQSIQAVGRSFLKEVYSGEITMACAEKGKEIASSIVECVQEDVSCIQAITGLSHHDHYTYEHSIRVSSITVAIAYKMGLRAEEELRDLALGGIYHDIGKKSVPLSVINKSGALTQQEWQQMRAHPEKGAEEIEKSILSYVPREIILHHHEKRDGTGYPHSLGKNELIDEVQIATLADIFDALTSNRSYQVSRSKYDALAFIKDKMLDTQVSPDAFNALISCLSNKAKS